MTEKRKGGHEDDIKEGHDKEGRCGRNDKGGWTLGSSPRVTEKRGYEDDEEKDSGLRLSGARMIQRGVAVGMTRRGWTLGSSPRVT